MTKSCTYPNCGTEFLPEFKKAVKKIRGAFTAAYNNRLKRRALYGTDARNAALKAIGVGWFAEYQYKHASGQWGNYKKTMKHSGLSAIVKKNGMSGFYSSSGNSATLKIQ